MKATASDNSAISRFPTMNSDALDRMIDRLAEIIPAAPLTFVKTHRSDWRPFWQLAGDIQAGFKDGVRYPTKGERDCAWLRFNALRDKAGDRAAEERERIRGQSERLRRMILSECSGITWSPLEDAIFFFDKTNTEQVKAWGQYLRKAMGMLSEHKHEMLGEHKQECFDKFQEIKESHDRFWQQYKEAHDARWQSRKVEIAEKVRSNIESNRDQHVIATEALARHRSRADELREKICETESEKWERIWGQWLAETEAKIDSIEEHIQRIEGWIEEDIRRLRELV